MNAMHRQESFSSQRKKRFKSKYLVILMLNYRLAELLLKKETVNLIDIVGVLGERPFPLKESLREYLTELRERQVHEKEEGEKKQDETDKHHEAGEAPSATSTGPTGQVSTEDLKKGKVGTHGSNIPTPKEID